MAHHPSSSRWSVVADMTSSPGPSSSTSSFSSYSSWSPSASSPNTSRSSSYDESISEHKPVPTHVAAPSAQELYEEHRRREQAKLSASKDASSRLGALQDWAWKRWIAFISCLGGELMEPWEIAYSIILYSLVLTLALAALWRTPRYLGYVVQRVSFYLTGSEVAVAEVAAEVGELLHECPKQRWAAQAAPQL